LRLEAEVDRRLFADPASREVSDEYLWKNGMSRETYDAALANIPQTWWDRLHAWRETPGPCGLATWPCLMGGMQSR
jgi:hypothetical protein